MRDNFSNETLTEEEAFWVMFYFLEGHYELSDNNFAVLDILSASQPFEFNEKGHIDGSVTNNRRTEPADNGMIWHWNQAVKKFREQGKPNPKSLKK